MDFGIDQNQRRLRISFWSTGALPRDWSAISAALLGFNLPRLAHPVHRTTAIAVIETQPGFDLSPNSVGVLSPISEQRAPQSPSMPIGGGRR
jgi:hypothetical protein